VETLDHASAKAPIYFVHQLKPYNNYLLSINGRTVKKVETDKNGDLILKLQRPSLSQKITLIDQNQTI